MFASRKYIFQLDFFVTLTQSSPPAFVIKVKNFVLLLLPTTRKGPEKDLWKTVNSKANIKVCITRTQLSVVPTHSSGHYTRLHRNWVTSALQTCCSSKFDFALEKYLITAWGATISDVGEHLICILYTMLLIRICL